MEFDRKRLCSVGAAYGVARQRWRRGLSRGWCVRQRRQGDVTGRLAACRSILAVQLRGEAMQGAWPHVL